ncbi:DUF4870 domain-containing protein [Riemerella anatipestifer]|nr:DUF4870 domain-containing protein [Riemerella anatipestifer]WPC16459.1 DUF4870 domain-containing protein [Riemerella anatipestifer]
MLIWAFKKDEIQGVNEQGKEVINFQITMFLGILVSIPLCFILIGFLFISIIVLLMIIVPIIQAIKSKDNQTVRYPLTIRFFSLKNNKGAYPFYSKLLYYFFTFYLI